MTNRQNLVVFDIDGTLVDSVATHQEALAAAIMASDLTHRDTVWSNYANHTDSGVYWEAFVKSFGHEPQAPDCRRFEMLFQALYDSLVVRGPLQEIAGARRMLEALTESGKWLVAFATGSYRGAAEHKLRQLGVEPGDRVLVTASEFRTRREIVSRAVALTLAGLPDAPAVNTVSVGDGPWDARTARELSIDFVGIGSGADGQRLREMGARGVVADYRDIAKFLDLIHAATGP